MALFDLASSFLTPAVTSGIGEAAIDTALPAITDTALQTGVDQALAGTLPSQLGNATAGLGLDSTFQTLGQAPMFTADGMIIPTASDLAGALPNASDGMFGDWGNQAMNVLGSDQAKNIIGLGVGGFNALNQGKALSNANKIQKEQLQMSKDAYNRDKSADEQRQKLVF